MIMTPMEEYHEKIEKAHHNTGHGGRDKIIYYLKNNSFIPRSAISLFLEMCETCNSKKSGRNLGVVVKPIISKDFNVRGQVDLIDFQSCADGEYKWLLNYQDHGTKFLYLRPLKSKMALEVALELMKIFLEQGAPHILQSDNGREFTADIVKQLLLLWPHCKIVHGRPRHPQTQGSVERSNQDVEQKLRTWMHENKSKNWSLGCYFVQWQKNITHHRIIGRSPYQSLFGNEPKMGLESTNIPSAIIKQLETEEDLDAFLANNANMIEMQNQENDFSIAEDKRNDAENLHVYCAACSEICVDMVYCLQCNNTIHEDCGHIKISSQSKGNEFLCNHCERANNIIVHREESFRGQLRAADQMLSQSNNKFPVLTVGSFVVVQISKVDRGPLDLKNIEGIILDVKDGNYQVGTKSGILKNWFNINQLTSVSKINFEQKDIFLDKVITLREACAEQSLFSGQGYTKCNCRTSAYQCTSNRCTCVKAQQICNSKCHPGLTCKNHQ